MGNLEQFRTFYFDHKYSAAGLETRVNARGKDVGGRTINTYDSNDNLIKVDKGEGDSQDRPEISRFLFNNDNQILYRFSDSGKNEDLTTDTEYLYANSKAVGETGTDVKGETVTKLGTGHYNLVQPMGEDFPSSAVTFVTASEGDNLQSIAAAVYGNPSLWFVLAEANGLQPGESLKEGQRIEVPNTVKTGRITAETHKVYDESEIVGSTLPNLKSDPKDSGCGSFLAIIIVAVIAVVAVYAVAFLAGTGAFAAAGSGLAAATGGLISANVGAFIVAGAVVGAAASAVQQGLFIALGYQEDFSWKSVAAGAVAGALSGGAQGYAQAAATTAKVAGETVGYADIAARALKVSSAASKQLIENGKITNWSSLAAAGLGSVKGVDGNGEISALVGPVGAGSALEYVTPWLGAAESFIRTGEVSPTSWASAVSSTLSTAASGLEGLEDTVLPGGELTGGQLLSNVVAGGVLSAYDRDAGQAYFESVIGNEVGSWIGGGIGQASGLAKRGADAFNAEVRRLKSEAPTPKSQGDVSLEENLAAGGIDLRRPQGTGGPDRLMSSQPTPVEPETYTLQKGDNPSSVARRILGSEAAEADVREYVYRLISANPDLVGANTRTLQPGMTLTLPTENQQVSQAALETYAGDGAFGQAAAMQTSSAGSAMESEVASLERMAAGLPDAVLADRLRSFDYRQDSRFNGDFAIPGQEAFTVTPVSSEQALMELLSFKAQGASPEQLRQAETVLATNVMMNAFQDEGFTQALAAADRATLADERVLELAILNQQKADMELAAFALDPEAVDYGFLGNLLPGRLQAEANGQIGVSSRTARLDAFNARADAGLEADLQRLDGLLTPLEGTAFEGLGQAGGLLGGFGLDVAHSVNKVVWGTVNYPGESWTSVKEGAAGLYNQLTDDPQAVFEGVFNSLKADVLAGHENMMAGDAFQAGSRFADPVLMAAGGAAAARKLSTLRYSDLKDAGTAGMLMASDIAQGARTGLGNATRGITERLNAIRDNYEFIEVRNGAFRGQAGAVGTWARKDRVSGQDGPNRNTLVNVQDAYPRPYINAETRRVLGNHPEGMKNPHIHHILEVNGRVGEHRALVREGQDLLRNYDIDPLKGVENLTYAPNKGHTKAAAQNLVDDLRSAQQAGEPREVIVEILKDHGQQAAGR